MATSNTVIGLGVIGLALAVLCGYMAHLSVDVETYPDVEVAAGASLNTPVTMAPHEFVTDNNSIVPQNYTPHRYPSVSGGNITALIHHGLSPLRKRAPSDAKWIECPPANVMWL